MQWGVGHGALRPFPQCFRILSYFSSVSFKFKDVLEKVFPSHFTCKNTIMKPIFCDILHLFLL